MIYKFGDQRLLAMELGLPDDPRGQLRPVDIWADDRLLTCDVNSVYVLTFLMHLEAKITHVLSDANLDMPFPELSAEENHKRLYASDDGLHFYHSLFDWGPTTDNILSLMFWRGANLHLTFEFCRETHHTPADIGRIFAVEIREREFLSILCQAVFALSQDLRSST